ncbi:MAG TPA: hypothetical protein VMV69_15340 [Pirellulales bacterium]|nr:hypothetical protein [Pirellulales bacterium]
MNYNARAKRIANYIHSRRLESHRGVMPLPEPGVSALFGNDDYSGDGRTRELVRRLFEVAHDAGYEVLGFATNDGADDAGCSWAVVLSTDQLDWLKARLHDAFFESHGLYAPRGSALGAAAGNDSYAHSETFSQEKPR